ncbi:MAG: flagellar hook-basal body complex protein FliE [Pirellulales bacterium]|nr:flagellar hook-basal body complex protein FliE [Pirellulales bacterium]
MHAIRPPALPVPPPPVQPAAPAPQQAADRSGPAATPFQDVLLHSIEQVNTLQQDAQRMVETMAVGGDVSPIDVLTAVQKADLAFRMMLQVRNKLVQAYQELQGVRV